MMHKLLKNKQSASVATAASSPSLPVCIQTFNKLSKQHKQHFSSLLPMHHFFSAHYSSIMSSSSQVYETSAASTSTLPSFSPPTSNFSLASATVFASMMQKSMPREFQNFLQQQQQQELVQQQQQLQKNYIVAAAGTIPKRVALAAKRKQEDLPKAKVLQEFIEKRHDCGEDAFFVATDFSSSNNESSLSQTVAALGIADGVGGYARLDIDPSLMAWQLMENAKACFYEELDLTHCPRQVMAHAFNTIRTKEQVAAGGCTACILLIQRDVNTGNLYLKSANLGDSGFIVIRNGNEIIYKTQEVTHGFNAPFQLAIPPKNHPTPVFQDDPNDAHMNETPLLLQEGDVIVLGTDGIFDNIFDEQVIDIVQANFAKYGKDNEQLAVNNCVSQLVELSRDQSLSRNIDTPFAKAARENSYYHRGGKPDDITCVVAVVGEFGATTVATGNNTAPESEPLAGKR